MQHCIPSLRYRGRALYCRLFANPIATIALILFTSQGTVAGKSSGAGLCCSLESVVILDAELQRIRDSSGFVPLGVWLQAEHRKAALLFVAGQWDFRRQDVTIND
jgi:hypothetical protein